MLFRSPASPASPHVPIQLKRLFTLLIVLPEPTYQVASSGPGSAGPIAHYASGPSSESTESTVTQWHPGSEFRRPRTARARDLLQDRIPTAGPVTVIVPSGPGPPVVPPGPITARMD